MTDLGFSADLFEGQTALVTGATSGIGHRTAEILARAGVANLAIVARTETDGLAARDQLRGLAPGARIEFVQADYLVAEDVGRLFSRIDEMFGRLDVFVHTMVTRAGPRSFASTDRRYWEKVIDALFLSFVDCCSHAVPLMKRSGGGSIVSIASDALRVPTPGESLIGGGMSANAMFAKVLALEEGRSGVRVNVVSPTITRGTRGYELAMANDYTRELFTKAEKRARLGLADALDVARTVAFLSSRLSAKTTGQVVSVNGGVSIA